jgi:hypothetical protein
LYLNSSPQKPLEIIKSWRERERERERIMNQLNIKEKEKEHHLE